MTAKCPHCGEKDNWYYRNCFLAKGGKELIEVSYCPHCNWRFIEHYKLHPVTHNGKLKFETQRQKSKWQLFCADGLAKGKTLKELSILYWQTWQTTHKFPTSLGRSNEKVEPTEEIP
jgi:hypothetical protein